MLVFVFDVVNVQIIILILLLIVSLEMNLLFFLTKILLQLLKLNFAFKLFSRDNLSKFLVKHGVLA